MSNEYLYALIVSNLFFFVIGFLSGRSTYSQSLAETKPKSVFDKKNTTKNAIEINDKKIVTNISTNDLEKKYIQLGEKKESSENISSTVNKLKNMKGS